MVAAAAAAAAAVSNLWIFPIKALDGVAVPEVTVLASGALSGDREYALVDDQDRYINGKNRAKVHLIRAAFDLEHRQVSLSAPEMETGQFHLDQQRSQLEAWCSVFLGIETHLVQNTTTGFPDDLVASGPTLISTETLATTASWFPNLSPDQMRARCRTNIEISGVPAFWEDHLFGAPDTVVPFQIGVVTVHGVNPCTRCIVPTRDAQTGEVLKGFQKIFVQNRQAALPASVDRSRFNHFYRLALNTIIPATQAGKQIRIGDPISLPPWPQRL